MGLTNNSSPPTKRWLRFSFRSHPCLRHGQAPLRSLVIRSGVASKKKEKFPKNEIFLKISYKWSFFEIFLILLNIWNLKFMLAMGDQTSKKKKYFTFMTTTLLLCTLVP